MKEQGEACRIFEKDKALKTSIFVTPETAPHTSDEGYTRKIHAVTEGGVQETFSRNV